MSPPGHAGVLCCDEKNRALQLTCRKQVTAVGNDQTGQRMPDLDVKAEPSSFGCFGRRRARTPCKRKRKTAESPAAYDVAQPVAFDEQRDVDEDRSEAFAHE